MANWSTVPETAAKVYRPVHNTTLAQRTVIYRHWIPPSLTVDDDTKQNAALALYCEPGLWHMAYTHGYIVQCYSAKCAVPTPSEWSVSVAKPQYIAFIWRVEILHAYLYSLHTYVFIFSKPLRLLYDFIFSKPLRLLYVFIFSKPLRLLYDF